MTPEQLDEIESRWYIAPDFQLMFAAVKSAWAERDAYKFAGEQAMGMGTGTAIMEERDELKHKLRRCGEARDVLERKVKARDNELDLLHKDKEENERLQAEVVTLQQFVGDAIMERNAYMREVKELKEAAAKPPRQKKQP